MKPFEYLSTVHGIREHLRAYLIKDPGMTDPEHYAHLKRGIGHVIDAAPCDHSFTSQFELWRAPNSPYAGDKNRMVTRCKYCGKEQ